MEFGKELAERMAELSRLSLSGSEAEELAERMARMTDYLRVLSSVETGETAAPRSVNALREDRAGQSLPREELLAVAPASDGVQFLVPRTVE